MSIQLFMEQRGLNEKSFSLQFIGNVEQLIPKYYRDWVSVWKFPKHMFLSAVVQLVTDSRPEHGHFKGQEYL